MNAPRPCPQIPELHLAPGRPLAPARGRIGASCRRRRNDVLEAAAAITAAPMWLLGLLIRVVLQRADLEQRHDVEVRGTQFPARDQRVEAGAGVGEAFLRRRGPCEADGRPLAGETEGLERLDPERAVQLLGVLDVPVAGVPRRGRGDEEALPCDEWHVFAHPNCRGQSTFQWQSLKLNGRPGDSRGLVAAAASRWVVYSEAPRAAFVTTVGSSLVERRLFDN